VSANEENFRTAARYAHDASVEFRSMMEWLTKSLKRASIDSGRWFDFEACINAFEKAQQLKVADPEYKALMKQYDRWKRLTLGSETSGVERNLMTAIHVQLTNRHFFDRAVKAFEDPTELSDWRHHNGIATDDDYED
jgi:hypothetical protein